MTLMGATITVAVLSTLTALLVFGLMAAELEAAARLAERHELNDADAACAGGEDKTRHGVSHRKAGTMATRRMGEEQRTS